MKYRVLIMPVAASAIDDQVAYYLSKGVAAKQISNWQARLLTALEKLARFPRAHAVSQIHSAVLGQDVRRMVYRNHLVFYVVDDRQRTVAIVGFRHAALPPQSN